MSRLRPVPVTVVAVLLGAVVDVLVGYSKFPGYPAVIGLGGCTAIIVISKWIGKRLLQRPESYYPADAPADVQEDLRG